MYPRYLKVQNAMNSLFDICWWTFFLNIANIDSRLCVPVFVGNIIWFFCFISKAPKRVCSTNSAIQWSWTIWHPKIWLRLALATCLNMDFSKCIVLIGLVCSSYVAVSSWTHRRYPHAPWGDVDCPFVALGSLLASRILAIQWLVLVKRGPQQWGDMSTIH